MKVNVTRPTSPCYNTTHACNNTMKHLVVPQKFHCNVMGSPRPNPVNTTFRQITKAKHSINTTRMKKYQKFYDCADTTCEQLGSEINSSRSGLSCYCCCVLLMPITSGVNLVQNLGDTRARPEGRNFGSKPRGP